MKIAQVVGYSIIGNGALRAAKEYCRNIERGKFEFHFIIYRNSPYSFEREILEFGGKQIKASLWELFGVFKKEKYDIVHSHLNTLNVFVMFFAWLAGVKVRISHSHSTMGKGEPLKNLIKSTLKPFTKIFVTIFFACSKHAGKWLFGNSQFVVFKNAIDTENFAFSQTARNEVRQELGILEGQFVLGHVGRFEPQKNHRFLLRIFEEILKIKPDSVLLLVGEGSLQEEIRKIANSNVKFLNARNDVHRIYNAMDAFVLPSIYEGLGIVGVEAQANGLPCFFSKEVPNEAGITDCTSFIGLDESAKKWAQDILTKKNTDRVGYSQNVMDAGYDIKIEAKKLEKFYEGVVRC